MRIDALSRIPGGNLPPFNQIPPSLQEAISEAHTLKSAAKDASNKEAGYFQSAWADHFKRSVYQAEDDPKCKPKSFQAHIETLKTVAGHFDNFVNLSQSGNGADMRSAFEAQIEPLISELPPPAAPDLGQYGT
jgi:hypothetical protein